MEYKFCPYCMNAVEDGKPCGACGLTGGSYTPSPHHLPPGTVLKERYLVGRVLGEGGFGITYIGCDLQLELKVAIKEYFPTDKASRIAQASLDVTSYTGAAGVNYDKGLQKFLQEARSIARMDKQPVIVNVRDFFSVNRTAYIVMEYVEGVTFKELVEQRGGRIPAGELLYLVEPLFFALREMHGNGLIHRDISPENLMLEKGELRLLDFGCARQVESGESTMTIALKHGYAPVEQYQSKGQGPWTDVYSLAATIYYCLTGRKPPQAMDRLVEDELTPPCNLGVDLTCQQEKALLYGMNVHPRRRFQSMEEFHTALYEGFVYNMEQEKNCGEDTHAADPAEHHTEEEDVLKKAEETKETKETEKINGKNVLAVWLKKNRFLAGGAAAALALMILAAVLIPKILRGGQDDLPDPDPFIPGTAAPSQSGEADYDSSSDGIDESSRPDMADTMTAENEEDLYLLLNADEVHTVIVPSNVILDVKEEIVLTKTLRIEQGAAVNFNGSFTAAEGSCVEVAGNLSSMLLLRTVGGGRILVESGGIVNSQMVWLEYEEDLICDRNGVVTVFSDYDPIKNPFNAYCMVHYWAFSEEELFADAVYVRSEEEFAQYCMGDTPVVIDSDVALTHVYKVNADILIPQGVTVEVSCDREYTESDEDSCPLEMNGGTVLINRGTLKGHLGLRSFSVEENGQGEFMDACLFVNYGTVEAALRMDVGAVINFGKLTVWENMHDIALSNLGTITVPKDAVLKQSGNWSNNTGEIHIFGNWVLEGGAGFNNNGSIFVENSGRMLNYGDVYHTFGSIVVSDDAVLENYSMLQADSRITAASRAFLVNNGIICYHTDVMELHTNISGNGHMIPFSWSETVNDGVWYVSSESELRKLLEDDGCKMIIWDDYSGEQIRITGEPLIVTKGLVFQSGESNPALLDEVDIIVTGENAFLINNCTDFRCNGLTVKEGGTVIWYSSRNGDFDRLDISDGGMVCAVNGLSMKDGEIVLNGDGRLISIRNVFLNDCNVRIEENGEWYSYGDIIQEGGIFTGNPVIYKGTIE